ncbi:MAG: hypothetical protein JNM43_25405 [Planctomycetaceae bacterium]|nr:hypothetical protein [Planctomycetaceae bacterium]
MRNHRERSTETLPLCGPLTCDFAVISPKKTPDAAIVSGGEIVACIGLPGH